MREFKANQLVRITKDLKESQTDYTFGLDGNGIMLSMQGKVFKINKLGGNFNKGGIWIKNPINDNIYIFHESDLKLVSTKPKIKKEKHVFDSNQLDF
jgi:hypothetical protein